MVHWRSGWRIGRGLSGRKVRCRCCHCCPCLPACTAVDVVWWANVHSTCSVPVVVLPNCKVIPCRTQMESESNVDAWRQLLVRLFDCFAVFTHAGGDLSGAIASWQQRHQLAAVLSTGFLDGSHPIVDAYELGVRLQHMLRRLTALAAGALVQVRVAQLVQIIVPALVMPLADTRTLS